MKKSLIYSRLSTQRQFSKNNTLTHQKKVCRSQVEKLNSSVLKIFSEVAKGDNPGRSELNAMEAFIHQNKKEIGYLIVADSKRMARSAEIAINLIKILKKYKIEFIDCTHSKLRGKESYLTFAKIAVEGELEIIINSKTTEQAIQNKISNGKSWGRPATGYKIVFDGSKGRLSINPDDKNEIKRIFSLALAGYSIEEIQSELYKEGYGEIHYNTLRFRLKNKKYAGYVKDNKGKWKKGNIPPIINISTYNAVQKLITSKTNRKKRKKRMLKNEDLPLRNWLLCENCGHSFTGSRIYYNCNKCNISMKNELLHMEFVKYLDTFDYVNPDTVGYVYDFLNYIQLFQKKIIEIREDTIDENKLIDDEIKNIVKHNLKVSIAEIDDLYNAELEYLNNLKARNNKKFNQFSNALLNIRDIIMNFKEINKLSDLWTTRNYDSKMLFLSDIYPGRRCCLLCLI